jgi:hypothetical protein
MAPLNLEQYLELLLGPKTAASAFDSDASRRRAWKDHCGELLPLVALGSRPWGWWQYEAPETSRARESTLEYLTRCGLLTGAERRHFENARFQTASAATRNP